MKKSNTKPVTKRKKKVAAEKPVASRQVKQMSMEDLKDVVGGFNGNFDLPIK